MVSTLINSNQTKFAELTADNCTQASSISLWNCTVMFFVHVACNSIVRVESTRAYRTAFIRHVQIYMLSWFNLDDTAESKCPTCTINRSLWVLKQSYNAVDTYTVTI